MESWTAYNMSSAKYILKGLTLLDNFSEKMLIQNVSLYVDQ